MPTSSRVFFRLVILMIFATFVAPSARAQDTAPSTQSALESTALRQSPNTSPAQRTLRTTGGEVTRVLLALGIVIVLILMLRWLLQRYLGVNLRGKQSSSVKVISRTPLAPRQQIVLLQVGKRIVVIGDSGGTLTALSQITDDDEVANLIGTSITTSDDAAASPRFGALLRREQTRFDDDTAAELPPQREEAADIDAARSELSGLLDRVRQLKRDAQPPGDDR